MGASKYIIKEKQDYDIPPTVKYVWKCITSIIKYFYNNYTCIIWLNPVTVFLKY